jgi:hypothetical protein
MGDRAEQRSERSMSDLTTFLDNSRVKPESVSPPKWEAGAEVTGSKAVITSRPMPAASNPVWDSVLTDMGLNPADWDVIGDLKYKTWEVLRKGADEPILMRSWRANLVAKIETSVEKTFANVDREIAAARKSNKARTGAIATGGRRSIVACLSDWQLGKGEGGGTAGTVQRVVAATDELVAYLKAEKRAGRTPEALYLSGLGDMVEGCGDNFYAMQLFEADLDNRQQDTLARRLLVDMVKRCAPYVPHVRMTSVPGNHGEQRNNGKANTTWSDNRDLAVFETAFEVLEAGGYDVSARLKSAGDENPLDLVLDVSGVGVVMVHGHQARDINKWYTAQSANRQRGDIWATNLLLCGHKHHFETQEIHAGRTSISVPSMDGGSYWFESTSGRGSLPGMVVLSVGEAHGQRGFGDIRLIGTPTL